MVNMGPIRGQYEAIRALANTRPGPIRGQYEANARPWPVRGWCRAVRALAGASLGRCETGARLVRGRHEASARPVRGRCEAGAGPMRGRCAGAPTRGRCEPWPTRGRCEANARPCEPWPVRGLGRCEAGARPVRGRYEALAGASLGLSSRGPGLGPGLGLGLSGLLLGSFGLSSRMRGDARCEAARPGLDTAPLCEERQRL